MTILNVGRPAGRYNEMRRVAELSRLSPEHGKMLILSRKLNEQIMIGDRITITVVAIRGGCVRLGIEAPRDVPVHRKEVYEALQKEGQDAPALGEKADHPGS